MDLDGAAKRIVDQLTHAGIRATVDARKLNPPCVQVRPPRLTYRFGKGWDADWDLWLMVPDTGQTAAFAAFGPLLDRVQDALGHVITTARADQPTLLPDGGVVPTYILSLTTRITA